MSTPLGREDFERWIMENALLRQAVTVQTEATLALAHEVRALAERLGAMAVQPAAGRDVADGIDAAWRGLQGLRELIEGAEPAPKRKRARR